MTARAKLYLTFFLVTFMVGCHIEGKVLQDGEPMPGRMVALEGEGLSLTTVTDSDGRYRFSNIEAGFYDLSLAAQGSTAQRVEKATDNTNVANVNFHLDSKTKRTTAQGIVMGSVDTNGTLVWRGIPYARAPVGDLRWQAARPPEAWAGDYWALAFPDACPQLAHLQTDYPLAKLGQVVGNEDCLYLNVWTPDFDTIPQGDDARPVMFWIHGGGNTAGESAIFDGKMLAEKYGVVVITTNYRLGVLGYFSHPALRDLAATELDQSANFAITDLIQALTWVQDNIAAFGGDPERVMIFGESAGAANVAALLASPKASGLFQRAAMQSGGLGWTDRFQAESPVAMGGSEFSSSELISQYLVADGSATDLTAADALQATMSSQAIVDYLQNKTPQELLAHFDGSRFGMYPYPSLVRDGITLPDAEPYALFADGNYNQVPVITGTNRDEVKIFMAFNPAFVPGGLPLFIKEPNYYHLAAYYQSTLWRARAVDEFARVLSNQAAPVFAYRFDWDEEPKILWNDVSELIGAAHFFEIPFVFNTPDTFTVKLATPLLFTPSYAEGRQTLSDSMSSYWAQFAYHGDPGFGYNDSESVRWADWSQNVADNNLILFDSVNDRGIRMVNNRLSIESVRDELQQDTGFDQPAQKCSVYRNTLGEDEWFNSQCGAYAQ